MSPIRMLARMLPVLMVTLSATGREAGPQINLGPGYHAILPGKILLAATVRGEGATLAWTQTAGPARVELERPQAAVTWGRAATPGRYEFTLTATRGDGVTIASTFVNVHPSGAGFGNPILPGMFPDPHVFAHDGRFYIYATSMENDAGAYGRASVWSSSDFVNWDMKLTNWPEYGKFGGDIWAPDVLPRDGRFYQFVTRSGGYETWFGVADHREGRWRNLGADNTPIVSGGPPAGRVVPAYNMDAQPFLDDDGACTCIGGGRSPWPRNSPGPARHRRRRSFSQGHQVAARWRRPAAMVLGGPRRDRRGHIGGVLARVPRCRL
ncbi:MAG: family 43 glycosylhydrolase [Kiritimatiellia bacterium]